MNQKVAYTTTRYKESRKPSADASSVGRWVIGTAVLFSAFGFAMGAGISWAAGFTFWGGVSFGFAMAGFVGFCVGVLRIATYDKKPYVDIQEHVTAPVIYDEEEPQLETISGNAAPLTPSSTLTHIVTHRNKSYEFSPTQLRLMINRVEEGNYIIARDYLGIETSMYSDTVCEIMGGLGYWQVTRKNGRVSARWKDAGIEWLNSRMRATPPTG